MNLYRFATGIVTVAVFFMMSGCAQEPVAQVEQAQRALLVADSVDADLYVADLYTAAQDSFTLAQMEIEGQKEASSTSRDYDHAEALLAFATETATQAQDQVEVRKEAMRAETESLLAQAEASIAQAGELMAAAARVKNSPVALVSLQEDARSAQSLVSDARAAMEFGDVSGAYDNARAAAEQAAAVVDGLSPEANEAAVPIS